MNNLRLTIIQSEIIWHSIPDNITSIESLMQGLKGETDLVLLPEMFTTGFSMDAGKYAEGMDGKAVSAMKDWSREINAYIGGSLIIKENGAFFNRFIFASPEGICYHYNKRHLFRMGGEDRSYTSGREHLTVNIKGWRVRPFVCYDLRFPVWSRNTPVHYDLAVYAANWPAARAHHWDTLLKARAIENQCYVAGVNRTGTDGKGIVYCGSSSVTGFRGEEIYNAGAEPGFRTVEISHEPLAEYRKEFPAWMDADDFRVVL